MDNTVLLPNEQLVVLFIGALIPLVGYVLNRYAPWISESVKGVVQVALAAVAGGVYAAIEAPGDLGFDNTTFQLILSSVVAALFAHNMLWKPAKVNTKLGATERTPVRE
jgi:hypothetical protein